MSSALELRKCSGMFVKIWTERHHFSACLTLKGTPNICLLGEEKVAIKRLIDFTSHLYNSEGIGYLVL